MAERDNELAATGTTVDNKVAENTTDNALVRRAVSWESASVFFLILVLLVGAYFRFSGLNWDENYHLHPDERFLTIVASSLHSVSDPISYLRTSESTLNPYNIGQTFYVYGNFPMTVTRYVAEGANAACSYLR